MIKNASIIAKMGSVGFIFNSVKFSEFITSIYSQDTESQLQESSADKSCEKRNDARTSI